MPLSRAVIVARLACVESIRAGKLCGLPWMRRAMSARSNDCSSSGSELQLITESLTVILEVTTGWPCSSTSIACSLSTVAPSTLASVARSVAGAVSVIIDAAGAVLDAEVVDGEEFMYCSIATTAASTSNWASQRSCDLMQKPQYQ